VLNNKKKDHNGWKLVDDFHVTVLFIGKEEDRLGKPLFIAFEEN